MGKVRVYRPLLRGLALSLLLHGLVLVPAVMLLAPPGGTRPLVALLLRPVEAPHLPGPEKTGPYSLLSADRSGTSVPKAEGRAPVPLQPQRVESPQQVEAAAREMGEFHPDEGLDPEALRGYRLEIARQARRLMAGRGRTMGESLRGRAEIRLRMGVGVPMVTLAQGSGQAALDETALDLMRQAAAAALMPETLRDKRVEILLPVIFGD